MHICHLTINPIDYERRILNQAESALQAGHKIEIVCLNLPKGDRKNYRLSADIFPLRTPFYKGGALKFLHFNWKAFLFLIKKPLEIIHCHDLWVLPAAVMLSVLKNCHLIYDAHEFYGGLEIFTRRKIRKKIWMAVEYLSIPFINILITVSEPLADLYKKKYPHLKKVVVIRNLPKNEDPDLRDIAAENFPVTEETVIIFQGHFRPGRGLINLFEAFSRTTGIHLVMIGGGELEGQLKRMVKTRDLLRRVTFLGYVPTDSLISLASKADLGVVLFEPTSENYAYALPNKFFEYIMAGIPVLASNIETFTHYIETYKIGITVNPSDVEAIARTLMEITSDNEKLSQWRENSRKASRELNWELESIKMNHIYDDI